MNNLILGILLLYLIFIILQNSCEGFELWQYYKYPYCGKCNVSNNEFDCNNCVIYDAVDGFKQNSNTYYKVIKGSKRQSLKFCQKDPECKSIDYDNLNAKAYLSKKNIPQSCLLQQTTNKFTHFSKPANQKNIQVDHKTINNITNLYKSDNINQEQPNKQLPKQNEPVQLPKQNEPVQLPKQNEPVQQPQPNDTIKHNIICPQIPKCPEMPKCPEIPKSRGFSKIVKVKRCKKRL